MIDDLYNINCEIWTCVLLYIWIFYINFIQHCSDSSVSEDAMIEPRTVATSALAIRRFNHSIRSHSYSPAHFSLNFSLAFNEPRVEYSQVNTLFSLFRDNEMYYDSCEIVPLIRAQYKIFQVAVRAPHFK
jgi:hypothetical protein